ncbi:hypothetical protein [Gloeothece verrucosa]|uniref:Uncharacterized protein n=1 Tax=Gloeothece verrucosa (strain PCC 7822) TaxID=497965 RepID=E0UC76_GLOV7|nr:hypothetical protein [Gloeothece verrucosa]ADN12833.1 conserved hypothetical protein [Gloeothece verrucosa PCC 7822]
MLYLAQVNKNTISGEMELQLLAHEKSEEIWEVSHSNSLSFPFHHYCDLAEGLLVLVEMSEPEQIQKIKPAKDWILKMIEKHLKDNKITPEFVEKEQERIEQWRQEITGQSLDLTRRHLEVETRRDQLQELEISLKQEKEKLEIRWQQLQKLQEEIQKEKEDLKKCSQPNKE